MLLPIRGQRFSLKPGMFVTVKLQGRQMAGVFVLPRHVVHDSNVVYVLEDNLLRIRPVRVARHFKESVYIDAGLSDGDRVIVTPLPGATDGMTVKIQPSGSANK